MMLAADGLSALRRDGGDKTQLNRAFIFLGTNIERKRNYIAALARLAELGVIAAISSVYETTPLGSKEGRDFYNGAVLLETHLTAHDLKRSLRRIEEEMGRIRTGDRDAPRPIDLDLVLYNRDQVDEPELHVPDPLILKRPFLALTLAQMAPEYVHPTDGRTLEEIAHSLESGADGMRLEPSMTAQVKQATNQIYSGEISHA
jgi:2-amino-4-hydroxy-6-hydroxymethyldihydropteridine diphosphokinase